MLILEHFLAYGVEFHLPGTLSTLSLSDMSRGQLKFYNYLQNNDIKKRDTKKLSAVEK